MATIRMKLESGSDAPLDFEIKVADLKSAGEIMQQLAKADGKSIYIVGDSGAFVINTARIIAAIVTP